MEITAAQNSVTEDSEQQFLRDKINRNYRLITHPIIYTQDLRTVTDSVTDKYIHGILQVLNDR